MITVIFFQSSSCSSDSQRYISCQIYYSSVKAYFSLLRIDNNLRKSGHGTEVLSSEFALSSLYLYLD